MSNQKPMTAERLEHLRASMKKNPFAFSMLEAELFREVERLKLRAETAEAERDKYVQLYGCLTCGEVHDGMCPPHEVRTTGMAALRTPQALRAADAARKEKP